MWQVALTALGVGLVSMSLAAAVLWLPKIADEIQQWLSLILIVVLTYIVGFDLLPHALEYGVPIWQVAVWVVVGAAVFGILQWLMERRHEHGESRRSFRAKKEAGEREHRSQAGAIFIADVLHTFMDGLMIGLGWLAGAATGWSVAFSVVAHEVPNRFNNFMALRRAKIPRGRIMLLGLGITAAIVIGASLAYMAGEEWRWLEDNRGVMLAVMGGFFLNIVVREVLIFGKMVRGRQGKKGTKARF
ncbi:ZIP family metal transporter [Candidatus Saccharibacteria bacterium]|nr:ZIP family metal transporter [Candidatus Saccharibacteria bacterium]